MTDWDQLQDEVSRRLAPFGRVAIGVSGGVDSVMLLTLAARARLDVCAVHVDHGLRQSSSLDARFCEELAAQLGVPFLSVPIEVRKGNSTQGRARVQRYGALVRGAVRLGADAIATAHHADDAIETSWLQRDRGAGPVGIAGLRETAEWAGFPVVRPLLQVRRERLELAAQRKGITWREDPTNASSDYARNALRNEVLPRTARPEDLLTEARDAADALTDETANLSREAEVAHGPVWRMYRRELLDAASEDATARLLLDAARSLHGELNRELVAAILAAIADNDTTSRQFCGRQVVVEVGAHHVALEATRGQGTRLLGARRAPQVQWVPAAEPLGWFEHRFAVTEDPSRAAFAVSSADPVTIRGPLPGDRVFLRGLDGHRRIHDLLADLEVPQFQRWRWPCVFSGDRCLYVAGLDLPALNDPNLLRSTVFSGIFVMWWRFPSCISRDVSTRTPASQMAPDRRDGSDR